jgi:ribonucleotide reductase alpha subunit
MDDIELDLESTTNLPMTRFIVQLFARGYTLRAIKKKVLLEYEKELTDTELLRYMDRYAPDIMAYQEQADQITLTTGLAKKEERVARLSELAEELEDDALKGNPKLAPIYLRTLKQIQEEMEPLGINVSLPPNDPWRILLENLREVAQRSLPSQSEHDTDQTSS